MRFVIFEGFDIFQLKSDERSAAESEDILLPLSWATILQNIIHIMIWHRSWEWNKAMH